MSLSDASLNGAGLGSCEATAPGNCASRTRISTFTSEKRGLRSSRRGAHEVVTEAGNEAQRRSRPPQHPPGQALGRVPELRVLDPAGREAGGLELKLEVIRRV